MGETTFEVGVSGDRAVLKIPGIFYKKRPVLFSHLSFKDRSLLFFSSDFRF